MAPDVWNWETAAEALHRAKRAVTVNPGRARNWVDLGRVHLRILTDLGGTVHDVDAGRKDFRRACELDPYLPWHWLELARLERVPGDHLEAIRLTRKALSMEPNTVRGWLVLGRLDRSREALAEAKNRRKLRSRPGINKYERELLEGPDGQFRQLDEGLR